MSRRQLLIAYAVILFVFTWGIELINAVKFGQPVRLTDAFSVFNFSQLIYAGATLLCTHWLLKRTAARHAQWQRLPFALMVVAAFVFLRYGLEEWLFPMLFSARNYNPKTPFLFYFLDNVYYAAVYIALGAFVYYADVATGARKRAQELLVRSRDAELAYLRAQINPHFLFNSLNNIYALSYKGSPKAPDAILRLSELMRYMLYEKKELMPLDTEWHYLHQFVALQQLRYERPVAADLQCNGLSDRWQLPPYLLLAFVENAFKHGDATRPFRFELTAGSTELLFVSENEVGHHQKDAGGGIGLANVRRRLELLYPGTHTLETGLHNERFRVCLRIQKPGAN